MYYTIKVQIRGITKPPVWRRLEVPADAKLSDLHRAIQGAFGWDDCHLYGFSNMSNTWFTETDESMSSRSFALSCGDPVPNLRVKEFFEMVGPKSLYTYDYGDNWEHLITVEAVNRGTAPKGMHCIAGKGACPPEDCGGVWGYREIKRLMASTDPADDEDRKRYLEWLGLDSPEAFDPNSCIYPSR